MHLGVINQQLSILRPQTPEALINALNRLAFTGAARDQDLSDFLGYARNVCRRKGQARKIEALDELSSLVALPSSSYFPHLSVRQVVYQLALRILDPKIVDQRSYGMCGPAAFLVTALKSRPLAVIKLACSLLVSGCGNFGGLRVEPDESVRNFRTTGTIEDADWLLLASLRNEKILREEIADVDHYGGTTIVEMFKWLRGAGYGSVVSLPSDNSLGTGILRSVVPSVAMTDYHPRRPQFLQSYRSSFMTSPAGNFSLARAFVANGWRVLCGVTETYANTLGDIDPVEARTGAVREAYRLLGQVPDPTQIESARQQAVAKLVGTATNHWVLVKNIEVTAAGKIRMTRYSWGNKGRTAPIDLGLFYSVYGGFVAVHLADLRSAESNWTTPDYLR